METPGVIKPIPVYGYNRWVTSMADLSLFAVSSLFTSATGTSSNIPDVYPTYQSVTTQLKMVAVVCEELSTNNPFLKSQVFLTPGTSYR